MLDNVLFWSQISFFSEKKFFESSFDVLDGLYRPGRPRAVGDVLNNSFHKGQFLKNKSRCQNFWLLKLSEIELLTLFWNGFYTIPSLKHLSNSLEASKLS